MTDIEARWNGGAWTTIATGKSVGQSFSASMSGLSEGQGVFEVRKVGQPGTGVAKYYVGIGEVFIVAGQSNASGQGTTSQVWTHASLWAGMFGNDYTWKRLLDPMDTSVGQIDAVSVDGLVSGSIWPLIATSGMAALSVPLAFVPCAKGGTSITSWLPGANHQDRTTLYGSMVYRALQTGCRCVLWWQGENDAVDGMSQSTYNGHLDTLANAINADLGVKLMPCLLPAAKPGSEYAPQANIDVINAAISEAWGDNSNVLTGPDLTGLTCESGAHITANATLASAATSWWSAIETAFGW